MTAAVIGASSESIYVINKAKELGLKVIALDRNPEAPGLKAADASFVVDIRDPQKVFEILDRDGNKPDVVLPVPIVTIVMLVFLIKGHVTGNNVLFLYKEDVDKINYAQANSGEVAVVMFNPATPHNVWRLTDELLQYDRVFYMNEENLDPLTEQGVVNSDKIVLYVADDDYKNDAIGNLVNSCKNLDSIKEVDSEDMWTTCEISGVEEHSFDKPKE